MDRARSDQARVATCDLCRAERLSTWYLADALCWVADCTVCATPMVVLRSHQGSPDRAIREALWSRLATVVARYFDFEHWIDDDMRRIPDHYHAHARPVGGFFGHGFARRSPAEPVVDHWALSADGSGGDRPRSSP